ncbi:MAG: metallophosphoesterase family protein [Bacteroidetes Order II. Incertae sedis bacterium]|nr:metallophosphoesterase family protein [Bacteroidetes Order II. bacterium]
MALAIISDIHSNLPALVSVLKVIESRGISDVYCLGDVVGYGADPAACLELVQKHCKSVVLGNHDLAVATGEGIDYLPRDGQTAALHNAENLSVEQRAWLANLPLVTSVDDITLAHASPGHPEKWLRVESFFLAQDQFNHFDTPVCFVGHTHLPGVLSDKIGVMRVRAGHRYMINVGSVGQPRDGDPRASFGIFDPVSFEFELIRTPYNVDRSVNRIREEGLPSGLGKRLEKGN